jgi:hypothetical protein
MTQLLSNNDAFKSWMKLDDVSHTTYMDLESCASAYRGSVYTEVVSN